MNKANFLEDPLWTFLSWFGVTYVPENSKGRLKKIARTAFIGTTVFASIYLNIVLIYNSYKRRKVIGVVPVFCEGLFAAYAWALAHKSQSKTGEILKKLSEFKRKTYERKFFNPAIYLKIVLPYIVIQSLLFAVIEGGRRFKLFIDLYFTSEILYRTFLFYVYLMHYIIFNFLPISIGIIFYVICKQVNFVLSNFEDYLMLKNGRFESSAIVHIAKMYNAFIVLIQDINHTFSPQLLLVVLCCLLDFVTYLVNILFHKSFFAYKWLLCDAWLSCCTHLFVQFIVSSVADEIKSRMERISDLFSQIYQDLLTDKYTDLNILLLMNHSAMKKSVEINPGGMFVLSRRFFVMALGTIFTYGLLFIQIEDNWRAKLE